MGFPAIHRFAFFALSFLLFCAVELAAGEVKHVVLVSVDGLGASYFGDARAEMPMLRKLAAEGATAEGMLTTFPSVTWPAHTSLITGTPPAKHGVIANTIFDRQAEKNVAYIGDPVYTKDEAVKVPTLYDAAHAAGLSCGAVIWPCCNGATALKWTVPDTNRPEQHAKYTTPSLFEELAAEKVDLKQIAVWGWDKKRAIDRDEMYVKVARHLLAKHQPNLLLVHLINVDGVEHDKGPHSPEALAAVALADKQVAAIAELLEQPPLAGKTALFVVSDHGFAPYQKNVRVNVLFRQKGLVEVDEKDAVTKRRAWCVPQGGSAFVYCLETEETARREWLAKWREELAKLEGVAEVLDADACAKLGLPRPEQNRQMADLVLAAKPGYAFSEGVAGEVLVTVEGTKGTHGHLPTTPGLAATFIAHGAGIKKGVKLGTISNLDVAPTIAQLLGVKLPTAEGKVLTEVLGD